MERTELVETEHAHSAPGEMVERGAPHRSQADDDYIKLTRICHDSTNLKRNAETIEGPFRRYRELHVRGSDGS